MGKPVPSGTRKLHVMIGIVCLLSLLAPQLVHGFYLPGSYMHPYADGEEVSAKVNSLTSIDTELPFGYYTLPFCKPPDGVKQVAENLGEVLMGDRIENSPYRFKMNVNESSVMLCLGHALDDNEVKHFKQRIDDFYQINLILDNLPVTRFTKAKDSDVVFRWTGFPIGFLDKKYYIYNHLRFKILIHDYEDAGIGQVMGTGDGIDSFPTESSVKKSGYLIVGFEVIPCSVPHSDPKDQELKPYDKLAPINCDPDGAYQEIKVGEQIVYSYDVTFVKSDIRWPSRWDAFLKMEGARVHWFSILNSLMVISFLAGIVFVIFLRTVRRDLTKYEELDKEAQAQMTEELSGWKLVVGDVFRAPVHTSLLCVMVGDGVQITGMAIVTILFAAFGFMSPASRGMLLTGMVFLYLFLGIAAGYVAARMWRTLTGKSQGWRSIAWKVACFFPGITFGVLTVLNSLLWANGSTGAIPISLFFILLALWFCISVPLTLLGGFLGVRAEQIQYPVRTNQIPREVPPQKYPSWLLVLGAGTLPFGTLFIELFFIMSSIWMGRVYYVFGFLFVVLVLLVIVCAEVSVVLTYMHLCVEDWRWWWKSFFASGSVAVYVFLYSINYLLFDLQVDGTVSSVLYIGYSLLMALAIMLATGTVGFLTSFYFVHYLFSSVKLD
ncbi:hypothetical protein R1flu_002152 [Riccia fluitans]|uniref:Transmembrane 9 superfamily member n=1 Tax=Riccia fluitans TaxID=41844 RepID=A0ABD1Y8N0_9MARC